MDVFLCVLFGALLSRVETRDVVSMSAGHVPLLEHNRLVEFLAVLGPPRATSALLPWGREYVPFFQPDSLSFSFSFSSHFFFFFLPLSFLYLLRFYDNEGHSL